MKERENITVKLIQINLGEKSIKLFLIEWNKFHNEINVIYRNI